MNSVLIGGYTLIEYILISNGVYDVLCALSILWFYNIYPFSELAKLHMNMFDSKADRNNPQVRRLMAYWVFTYGLVRTLSGLHNDKTLNFMAVLTYYIEGSVFLNEILVNKMVKDKTYFVVISSFFLGVLVNFRSTSPLP